MPVEADAVADALRVDLAAAGRGGIEAAEAAEALLRFADVARRAGRDVEHAVGPEAQGLEAVMALARQIVDHHDGLRRIAELLLDRVVARDAPDLRDVERALDDRDAVRRLQPARDDERRAAAGRDGVDAVARAADEQRAALAERERARLLHVLRVHADPESGRQPDVL